MIPLSNVKYGKRGIDMEESVAKFIEYCGIDTQSDELSTSTPSAEKELVLSRLLLKELIELGLEARINEFGIVYAKLDGEPGLDPIGFNAHVDTAGEISGLNVKPRLVENYDGGTIVLNDDFSMSPKEFDSLKNREGQSLLVTDGTTLLGGDDKAGVAIIMAMLRYYVRHPEIKHHPICVCFTCDEEIGRGPEHFDAIAFGADYAYTIDGDAIDEIAFENFNAAHAKVTIHGVTIHPGEAKGKMVNASRLINEFDSLLSQTDRPELTEGREGFNHLIEMTGTCEFAEASYIIRNHDLEKLNNQINSFELAQKALQKKYPTAKILLETGLDYKNMKEMIDKDPRAVNHAVAVFKKLGIEPVFPPIRGGTDGATFSFKGCPTPNLGNGSYNHHGRFEFLSIDEFVKMIDIVIALVKAE